MRNASRSRFLITRKWIITTLLVIVLIAACAPAGRVLPETGSQNELRAGPSNKSLPVNQSASGAQNHQALLIGQGERADTFDMVLTDLQTGKPAAGKSPIRLGSEMNYGFSPDRTRLIISAKNADCPVACLRIFELPGLKETAKITLPEMNTSTDYVHQIIFDPKSSRAAIAFGIEGKTRIAVINTGGSSPGILRERPVAAMARMMAFSEDGRKIMLVAYSSQQNGDGPPGNRPLLQALLLDAETLEIQWQSDLRQVRDGFFGSSNPEKPEENVYYSAGMAVDSSRQRVYIAHADEAKLTTVDFQQEKVTTIDIGEKRGLLERMIESVLSIGVQPVHAKAMNSYFRQALLSADGQTLYVVGTQDNMVKKDDNQWERIYTPLGLEAWDIASGNRLYSVETNASEIRRSSDGRLLLNGYSHSASAYEPFTEVADPATGEIAAHRESTYAFTTVRLDGSPALVSVYSTDQSKTLLSTLNANTLEPEVSWSEDEYVFMPEVR